MKEFLWAFSFLTIVPCNRERDTSSPDIGKILFWFPVVGLLIGLFLVVVYLPLLKVFPSEVADAIILLVYFFLIGGLHLDGFADTCDGIFGGKDRESRLRIMRDSRIGSFGVLGLICLIGTKYLCFHSICTEGMIGKPFMTIFRDINVPGAWISNVSSWLKVEPQTIYNKCALLFLMPSVGRWTQTLGASISRYARGDEPGTGMLVIQGARITHTVCAAIIPFVLTCLFCSITGLITFAVIVLSSIGFVQFIKSRIGGMTGDTLGALNEASELIFVGAFSLYGLHVN